MLALSSRKTNPKSSYKRILMAPPCRLIFLIFTPTWRRSSWSYGQPVTTLSRADRLQACARHKRNLSMPEETSGGWHIILSLVGHPPLTVLSLPGKPSPWRWKAEEKGHNHPPLVFFWLWRWVVASDARHIIKLFWVVPGGKARGDDSCFLLAPLAVSSMPNHFGCGHAGWNFAGTLTSRRSLRPFHGGCLVKRPKVAKFLER